MNANTKLAANAAVLEVKRVRHSYAGAPALNDVSFTVPAGGVAALLGPSGCGKSTMLRVIAGLIQPAHGSVWLGGKDLIAVPARERRIGMVFQSYALFPHMSVRENVAYGLSSLQLSRDERHARVTEMLGLVQMGHLADRMPRELSGGQQQRVAVARALAMRPTVILLDEPFAALDRALRADLQAEFVAMQRALGITAILVTHDQEEAQAVADTLIVMNRGSVEQIGTPAELYDRPATPFVSGFIGQSSTMTGTVISAEDDDYSVRLAVGAELSLPRPAAFRTGSEVLVSVRPEHVRVVGTPQAGSLPAQCLQSVVQGADVLHRLALADGTLLLARQPRGAAAPELPDSRVHAVIDTVACRVFPANAPAATA
ncbi:putative spermidine/putrescine transport system ATP-binding protein [Rhodoferax sp. OV413]|uniref:ABC transporter ATP-binding protein n=1 Tax=Rhodoferax sp. OV413 TaxID=1855285 RepID=UPI00088FD1D4|nr:ABC transporter ATP-binding protein [Rhodoferax sp. OV413]SDP85903.1 putative spermidine/putrescine transport system ATP-binding protein [Rhodoferax sp. OV413]